MRSMLEYQFCIHSSYRRLELLTSIDNCFEWFCVYSLMLDLVVSTPWILISQILPFVCNFGKISNGCDRQGEAVEKLCGGRFLCEALGFITLAFIILLFVCFGLAMPIQFILEFDVVVCRCKYNNPC
ncbi:hypothetical protein AAZX31_10G050000 [Glycine max]